MHNATGRSRRVGVLAGFGLALLTGCGDQANVGYTEANCQGDKIHCGELPKYTSLSQSSQPVEITPGPLPTLMPTWETVNGGSDGQMVAGVGGTFWSATAVLGLTGIRLWQLNADGGVLGTQDILPPADLKCVQQDIPVFSLNQGDPGPTLVVGWSVHCPGGIYDTQAEVIDFGSSVSEPVTRADLDVTGNTVPPVLARKAQSNEHAVLPLFPKGWAPTRIDAAGDIVWQQSSIAREFYDRELEFGNFTYASLFWGVDGSLVVIGELPQDQGSVTPSMVVLDWETGSVQSRTAVPGLLLDGSATFALDSEGRTVVAGSTYSGDISWSRSQGAALDERTIIREGYTYLAVQSLIADSVGGTYLVTASGDRNAAVQTLCYMNDAMAISCALVPEARNFVVSDIPGVLYAQAWDQQTGTRLARFDFPI
ncbi:MAG: hypothetical protein QM778_21410 [Myxococcales bacterium]